MSFDDYGYDGERARLEGERGMQQASDAERVQDWKQTVGWWVRQLRPGTEFTADTLARAIGLPDELGSRARPNNSVGAQFSALSRAGTICWTGSYRRSERVVGHGNLQRVWMKR